MQKDRFLKIEQYMDSCMKDAAHDSQHIYRVLYHALDIAKDYKANQDVLIAAALLHDIGREAQFRNPECDHALVGADMAFDFLRTIGWTEAAASHVKACISTHRYRNDNPPLSIEAKILFDSDKLDVAGTMGIARTLTYQGIIGEPLYHVDENGNVLVGKEDNRESFFHEYNWKLKNVYDRLFTARARTIAEERRKAGIDFYESMLREVKSTYQAGLCLLNDALGDN